VQLLGLRIMSAVRKNDQSAATSVHGSRTRAARSQHIPVVRGFRLFDQYRVIRRRRDQWRAQDEHLLHGAKT